MILPAAADCVSNRRVKLQPPEELVDLLARLRLARADQVRAAAGRVRRLARNLPAFDSVWIDALAQARVLTPYQADEIHAGRGLGLQVGRAVIHQPLASPAYARTFRAWDSESARWVRLTLLKAPGDETAALAGRLKTLVRLGVRLPPESRVLPVVAFGAEGETAWTLAPGVRGETAAEWMVRHGRFPPAVVADIARQMLAALAACEQAEIVHGDLGVGQIWLDPRGQVWLPEPGLRAAVRPEEGYGRATLPCEAFDCLAPERVVSGGPADLAGDLYACGCVWWQMLAGRPALGGATALAKMRAAQTARIEDIRMLAPDVEPALAEAIADCLHRDPQRRPHSISALAERLNAGSPKARRALARSVRRSDRTFRLASPIAAASSRSSRRATLGIAAAGLLMALVVGVWPLGARWLEQVRGPLAKQNASPKGRDVSAGAVDAKRMQSASTETPARQAHRDDSVVQASWTPEENVLELDASQPLRMSELALSPGQTVRGRSGKRVQLIVPTGGLEIDVDDISFENVDFVGGASPAAGTNRKRAIVRVRAWRASFAGCSFQSSEGGKSPHKSLPAAIEWLGKPATADAELELPSGQLTFERCIFHRVSAGIDCRLDAAAVFELSEVLHLGPGPLVVLDAAPQADEPVKLTMSHVTLRGAAGLLECRYGELGAAPGRLAVEASNCAFVPAEGQGLFLFRGEAHPEPLFEQLVWTGQGSVLARESPLALWERAQGQALAAAEESIQAEGLVRTDVGFAGDAEESPGASRIVRWQVPLRSTDPPGIAEEAFETLDFIGR